jgi:non-ribosomal peptide synthetase component E (peptide arylation enzyme)
MNLMMLLEMQADAFGDRVAVGDSATGLRFSDLFEQAGKLAALLRSGDAERLAFVDIASPSLPVALYGSS